MKKNCFLLFFFSVITLHVAAQGFQKLYGGANQEVARHVISALDGIYFLGSTTTIGAGMGDLVLAKVDLSGNVVWAKTYGGAFDELPDQLTIAADGGLVIASSSTSFNANHKEEFLLFKTNSNGSIVWQKLFPTNTRIAPEALIRTFDNGIAIAGLTYVNGFYHAFLVRTNSAGDTLFTSIYGSNVADDLGIGLTQTPDGGFVLSGRTLTNANNHADIYLLKTDASGNMIWAKSFSSPGWEEAESVTIDNNGNYLVCGGSDNWSGGSFDILLWNCDTAGNYIWGKTYGGDKVDASYCVHQISNGSIIVSGYTNSMGFGHLLGQDTLQNSRGDDSTNIFLMKTNNVGDTIWTEAFGSGRQDEAMYFDLMSDGGYVIPAWSNSYSAADSMQMLLIRTNSQGFSGCHEQRGHPIIIPATYTPQLLPFTQTRGMAVSNVNLTVQAWNIPTDDACLLTSISPPPETNESAFSVFPNPTGDNLSLHFSGVNYKPALLTIYNLLGEFVFSKSINSIDQELNFSFISRGTYVVEVRMENCVLRSKVIKM